jgi:hypothetical protein
MNGHSWVEEEDREPDVTRIRDEAANKNAVRNRMRMDRIELPPDRLSGVISCGRDFFHTFINGTLGRRYKRPPIYLVDNWVIGALGAFMARGRRRLPGARSEHGAPYEVDVTAPIPGIGPALELFRALNAVQELLGGVRLLRVQSVTASLERRCLDLIRGNGKVEDLAHEALQVGELVQRAVDALQRDLFVGPHVEPLLSKQLHEAITTLLRAADAVARSPSPELPGTGFSSERPAGVLYGSIPELDIEGPAILLAPARILAWADGPAFRDLRGLSRDIAPEWMEAWFGVRDHRQGVGAVALVNVLHHEMTHAMVGLPTDAVEDANHLFVQRWRFYDEHPEFEEGFCDATAAVSTGVALLKAMFDIKGRGIPRLNDGKYGSAWGPVASAIEPSWRDYYGDSTRTWLNAWEKNKRDFKAFSGVIGLYATNFGGFDWMQTFDAFQRGQISTGR